MTSAVSRRKLTAIILDEASILTTPAILPLLSHGPRILWVLGDDNQLKPTVLNYSAILEGMDFSFMNVFMT